MAKELPGSTAPIKADEPELRMKSRGDPVVVYNASTSSPEDRLKLHRHFYREVLLAKILSSSAGDFSNGFEIADRIDKQIPEKHDVAETHRERQLAFEQSHTNLLSRRNVQLLSERLQQRNRPKAAREALLSWLKAKETQYRPQGPAGLIRLSEEYVSLLDDRKTAADLLIEATKNSPKTEEITQRLERLGYRFQNGKWMSDEARKGDPSKAETKNRHNGLIEVGMAPDDVWKVLGGAPSSVARVATSDLVIEVWSYGQRGRQRIIVRFERRRTQASSQAKVVEISQLQGR